VLYHWFNVNLYNGSLPKELADCRTTLEASRALKADSLAKHEAFIVCASYSECSFHSEYKGASLKHLKVKTCLMDVFGKHGNVDFVGRAERHDRIMTPNGELTASWKYDEKAGAPFETKNFWTDFEAEYDLVRALLKDIEFVADVDRWENVLALRDAGWTYGSIK